MIYFRNFVVEIQIDFITANLNLGSIIILKAGLPNLKKLDTLHPKSL